MGPEGDAQKYDIGAVASPKAGTLMRLLLSICMITCSLSAAHSEESQLPFSAFDDKGGYRLTIERRAALPRGAVETPRASSASRWSAPFCKAWTDGCLECSGSGLENEVYCKDRNISACIPSKVRCIEVDWHIAPLYCAGIMEECSEAMFSVDGNGKRQDASHGICPVERTRRDPEDYKCISFRSAFEECSKNSDAMSCRKQARAFSAAQAVRERLLIMFQESEALQP